MHKHRIKPPRLNSLENGPARKLIKQSINRKLRTYLPQARRTLKNISYDFYLNLSYMMKSIQSRFVRSDVQIKILFVSKTMFVSGYLHGRCVHRSQGPEARFPSPSEGPQVCCGLQSGMDSKYLFIF